MNKSFSLFAAAALLASSAVFAETSYEYADVLESRPVYQVVEVSEPFEQCWEEEVAIDRYPSRSGSNTPLESAPLSVAPLVMQLVAGRATSAWAR